MAKTNWLDLGLSEDQEKQVQEGAQLYRATYLDTIDNVFKIAKAIEILRTANYGTGVQGGFAEALVQYGFTDRDGGPMDKGIRSNFKALLDHEADVRAWWAGVPARRKRDWLSGRAIYRHWQADRKTPEQKAAEKAKREAAKAAYRTKMAPLAQPQDWVAKPKPPVEAMEARMAANAEAEAREMAAKHEVAELQARVAELEAREAPTAPGSILDALVLLVDSLESFGDDLAAPAVGRLNYVDLIDLSKRITHLAAALKKAARKAKPDPESGADETPPAAPAKRGRGRPRKTKAAPPASAADGDDLAIPPFLQR